MTDHPDVEDLLSRFRQWLETARAEAELPEPPSLAETEEGDFGLYRLVEEFTALRHELKLQTRSARGLQEQAEALLPPLQHAIDQFRAVAPREAQAAWSAGKPLAEALADLDEAVDRGRIATEHALERLAEGPAAASETTLDTLFARQSWLGRRLLRSYHEQARTLVRDSETRENRALLDSLREGYELVQSRLLRALKAERIERVDALGRLVDPERMIVVEVVDDPGRPPGQVVAEVRRGYTWQGRLLRPAEVRASRNRSNS